MNRATSTVAGAPAAGGTRRKAGTTSIDSLSRDRFRGAYTNALRARFIDTKILSLLKQGKVFFHIGGSGHEIAQIATVLALRPGHDWAYPYYRDLAFALQFGYTVDEVMLEALHRRGSPSSNGYAMPFHYGHKKWRMVSQSSCTGTQYLQAVGTAMGAVKDGTDEVVYVSSGEGATSEGEFHEAVNWAARGRYPVVFVIQNNKYAISVPLSEQVAGESVYEMVKGYKGLKSYRADGCDFREMFDVASDAVSRARRGDGPSVIEADTVRLLPHSSSDDQRKYRDSRELQEDLKRDPLPRLEALMMEKSVLRPDDIQKLREKVHREIDEAADRCEQEPLPDPAELERFVYSPVVTVPADGFGEPEHTGRKTVLVDAVNHALAEEMERNPKMLIYGEDVAGSKGGVFTATKGLTEKFGNDRVFNSPLAEASIVGT
ncbi:MAG: tungsten formylmethanofuran dehydrogenase, partial [Bacteroidetes bacterium]|nr:tungsten formylmethanofuran dehydrogenase [Bacteroidota bacterium]